MEESVLKRNVVDNNKDLSVVGRTVYNGMSIKNNNESHLKQRLNINICNKNDVGTRIYIS